MARWQDDDWTLVLDLYFRVGFRTDSGRISERHPEVRTLAEYLTRTSDQRTPDAVLLKLRDFSDFDPEYRGDAWNQGAPVDNTRWDRFQGDAQRIRAAADHIRGARE